MDKVQYALDGCGRNIVKPDDFDKICLVRSTSEYDRYHLYISRLDEYVIEKCCAKENHNQILTEALAEVVCEMINENPIIQGEKTFINRDSVPWYHSVTVSTSYPMLKKTEAKKTGWLD